MKETRKLNEIMAKLTRRTKRYPHGKLNGKRKLKHRIAAEKALGKPLPFGAVVHHLDGNIKNWTNTNLVVCPDQEYHRLLHARGKALGLE